MFLDYALKSVLFMDIKQCLVWIQNILFEVNKKVFHDEAVFCENFKVNCKVCVKLYLKSSY